MKNIKWLVYLIATKKFDIYKGIKEYFEFRNKLEYVDSFFFYKIETAHVMCSSTTQTTNIYSLFTQTYVST